MKLKIKKTELIPLEENPTTGEAAPQPFYDMFTHGVTQGLLTRFLICPEKHKLGAVEGWSPTRTGGALAFGSLVHDLLDRVYSLSSAYIKTGQDIPPGFVDSLLDMNLQELEDVDRQKLREGLSSSPYSEQELEANYGMAEVILRSYFNHWSKDSASYHWQSLEEVFGVPYTYPDGRTLQIRGKFDGVFRTGNNNRLWLFETKTKARIEEDDIVSTLGYNLQVCLYLWAIRRVYGERPVGVVYNLIRKPQLRQGKTESIRQFLERCRTDISVRPDFYFIRYNYIIDKDEMKRWEKDFHSAMKMLLDWHDGKFHFRNSTSCLGKFYRCEFLGVCSSGDYSYLQKREVPYPELESSGTESE